MMRFSRGSSLRILWTHPDPAQPSSAAPRCSCAWLREYTHTSVFFVGPSAGSYRPFRFGLFKLSNSCGSVICFTEMRRISSDERNENEMDVDSAVTGCAGSAILVVWTVLLLLLLLCCCWLIASSRRKSHLLPVPLPKFGKHGHGQGHRGTRTHGFVSCQQADERIQLASTSSEGEGEGKHANVHCSSPQSSAEAALYPSSASLSARSDFRVPDDAAYINSHGVDFKWPASSQA